MILVQISITAVLVTIAADTKKNVNLESAESSPTVATGYAKREKNVLGIVHCSAVEMQMRTGK